MKPQCGRFTIGRMMFAVAACAFLIPFPIGMVVGGALVAVLWWLLLHLAWIIDEGVDGRPRRPAVVDLLVPFMAGVWSIVVGIGSMTPHATHREYAGDLLFVILAIPNTSGPLYAYGRARRGLTLTGGHLLWAWAGLVWSILGFCVQPHTRVVNPQAMADAARLTLIVVVLAILYAPRPVAKEGAWAHHAGWLVVEADLIAWGLSASRFLR